MAASSKHQPPDLKTTLKTLATMALSAVLAFSGPLDSIAYAMGLTPEAAASDLVAVSDGNETVRPEASSGHTVTGSATLANIDLSDHDPANEETTYRVSVAIANEANSPVATCLVSMDDVTGNGDGTYRIPFTVPDVDLTWFAGAKLHANVTVTKGSSTLCSVDAPVSDVQVAASIRSVTIEPKKMGDTDPVVDCTIQMTGAEAGDEYLIETRLVDSKTGGQVGDVEATRDTVSEDGTLSVLVPVTDAQVQAGFTVRTRVFEADGSDDARHATYHMTDGGAVAVTPATGAQGYQFRAMHESLKDASGTVGGTGTPQVDSTSLVSLWGKGGQTKNVEAASNAFFSDMVNVSGLTMADIEAGKADSIEIAGELRDVATGETVATGKAEAKLSYVNANGIAQVGVEYYPVDLTGMGGHTLASVIRLYVDGKLVSEHNADLSDPDEMMVVSPTVTTEAHVYKMSGAAPAVMDTVTLQGGDPEATYYIETRLADPETGELHLTSDGSEVWTVTVAQLGEDGSIDVYVPYSDDMVGTDVVVYERVFEQVQGATEADRTYHIEQSSQYGKAFALFPATNADGYDDGTEELYVYRGMHEDPSDPAQVFNVPEDKAEEPELSVRLTGSNLLVGHSAFSQKTPEAADGHEAYDSVDMAVQGVEVPEDEISTMVDLSGYTLRATLYDVTAHEVVAVEEAPVRSVNVFKDGHAGVGGPDFTGLALASRAGHTLACSQELLKDGVVVSSHNRDHTDPDQMVTVAPSVATEASVASVDGDTATVTDTLVAQGADTDATYHIETRLADAATGDLLTNADGSEVWAETDVTFDANGSATVTLEVPTDLLSGEGVTLMERVFELTEHRENNVLEQDENGNYIYKWNYIYTFHLANPESEAYNDVYKRVEAVSEAPEGMMYLYRAMHEDPSDSRQTVSWEPLEVSLAGSILSVGHSATIHKIAEAADGHAVYDEVDILVENAPEPDESEGEVSACADLTGYVLRSTLCDVTAGEVIEVQENELGQANLNMSNLASMSVDFIDVALSGRGGHVIACSQELLKDGVVVSSHNMDFTDPDQEITVALSLTTKASVASVEGDVAHVEDLMCAQGADEDATYYVETRLADAETGELVLTDEGTEVWATNEVTFDDNGQATVELEIPCELLEDDGVVLLERVFEESEPIDRDAISSLVYRPDTFHLADLNPVYYGDMYKRVDIEGEAPEGVECLYRGRHEDASDADQCAKLAEPEEEAPKEEPRPEESAPQMGGGILAASVLTGGALLTAMGLRRRRR